ncbi:MAG: polyketide cyclase, partial [Pseudanabaena sp.]
SASIKISEINTNRSFTVESKLPLCIMKFTHELIQEGDTTKVTHGVEFHGPLAFLFSKIIGKQIYESFPVTLEGLKKKIESA